MPFVAQRTAARTAALWRHPGVPPVGRRLLPRVTVTSARRPIEAAGLYDAFNETTPNPALWDDLGAQAPTVAAGKMTVGDPASGGTRLRTRRPINMVGGSVTIESAVLRTDALVTYTIASTLPGMSFVFSADHGTVTWSLVGSTTVGATISPFVAADWRWIRVASDPTATDEVTAWAGPNITSWTELGTVTVTDVDRLATVDVTIVGAS